MAMQIRITNPSLIKRYPNNVFYYKFSLFMNTLFYVHFLNTKLYKSIMFIQDQFTYLYTSAYTEISKQNSMKERGLFYRVFHHSNKRIFVRETPF